MSDSAKPKKPFAQKRVKSLGKWIETENEEESNNRFVMLNALPSFLASFLLNISLILILALLVLKTTQEITVSLEAGEIDSPALEDTSVNLENLEFDDSQLFETEMTDAPSEAVSEDAEPLTVETDIFADDASLFAGETTNFDGQQFTELSMSELTNEMSGRGENTRAQLLRKYGGNVASESAVELALQWIADHQMPDGSWNLDHTMGPTINSRPRTSPNPGEMESAKYGATALALLPFLGNGQTHRNGKYKNVVFDGLKYLMQRPNQFMKPRRGICYWDDDGEMYSHGLVSIVLAEAYTMTNDEKLRDYVEGTLEFIADCQDPVGGGWRYGYRDRGDTSVVGWQIMALKSGKLSGIDVKNRTFKLANKFLDSVSTDYGAYYGYQQKPVKNGDNFDRGYRARSAVGLLCRMYMGWDKDRQGIVDGVDWFSEMGPDTSKDPNVAVNMYYNYYATQVMKHYDGEKWRKWNLQMRDFLIDTQIKEGVAKGSWHFNPNGQFQGPAGRLYTTSLACLTLEVYYRYLPLYQEAATEAEFVTD